MKHLKRYAALCMALVVACSALAVPASATDYQSTYNFWNWAYDNSWFLGKAIIGFSAGNVCQVSEDSMHHATTHSGGGGSVDGQRVYNCVCDLCGESFTAVATDLEQSYDSYEDTNTVNSSSSGPQPTVSNWFLKPSLFSDNENYKYYSFDYVAPNEYYIDYALLTSGKSMNYAIRCSVFINCDIVSSYTVNLPAGSIFDGTQRSGGVYYCYKSVDGNLSYLGSVYDDSYSGKSPTYICEGGVEYVFEYRTPANLSAELGVRKTSLHVMERPTVTINSYNQPYTEVYNYLPPSGTLYYNDSDNVSVTVDDPVVDVSNKTIYNPVTNTTTNITNWSYDYSDRSYTCTTENNTTTTITYGDEYITINEGDENNTYITYNIYYYTAPDSSGDGDSSGSDGSGDDDGGGLLDKIGELIGSVLGGFIDVIGAALGKVIDSLIDLVTLTIDKLVNVINLFGSFGDALGILWSWLPEEVVTVLVSGVTVIVFASVIKLFMR